MSQIHRVIYRAIVEIHQTKLGSSVEGLKDENRIKFKIINDERFIDRIFDISFDLTDDEQTFETYQKSIPDFHDPFSPAKWLTKYYIFKENNISKLKLFEKINAWSLKLDTILTEKKITGIIDEVFESPKVVEHASKVAFDMGRNGEDLFVDASQINEVAWFMKGKFRIKRVELDGRLCYFNGEFYDNKTQEVIQRETRKCIFRSKKNSLSEVVSYVTDIADIITWNDIMKYATIICFKNGLYNVITGKFEDFNPDYIVMGQIPYKFDETKTFEKIDAVVDGIINDERNKKAYYNFGSTIFLPFTGLTFMLGFLGETGTSKSQLGELLTTIVGDNNATNLTLHKIADDSTSRIDVATSWLNFDEEVSKHDLKNINVLKKWAMQERMTDRSIYEHSINFRPRSSLMFSSNKIFEIASQEDADAIYERTHLIETKNKFRGRLDDIKNVFLKIIQKDESQADAFATYLVKNATVIFNAGRVEGRQKANEVEAIWNKFGNWVRQFVKGRVKRVKGSFEDRIEWWDSWQEYANLHNFSIGGKIKFYDKVQQVLDVEVQQERLADGVTRAWGYNGFRLMTPEEVENNEQSELFVEDKKIDITIDFEKFT